MENTNYFMELLGTIPNVTGSFNLWQKDGSRYRNLATLFLNDPMCGCQWDVSNLQRAVSYDETDINDELENPLRPIPNEVGEHLIGMKDRNYRDVFEYLKNESEKREHIAGVKFYTKGEEK